MEKISKETKDFIEMVRHQIRYPSELLVGKFSMEKINIVTKLVFENIKDDVYVFATGLDDYIFSKEMEDTMYDFSRGRYKLKILFTQEIEESSLPKNFQNMIFFRKLRIFCGVENFKFGSIETAFTLKHVGYPILSGFMCVDRFFPKNEEPFGTYRFRFQMKERKLFIDFYNSMVNASKSKNPSLL
jgi:hypothetical protein